MEDYDTACKDAVVIEKTFDGILAELGKVGFMVPCSENEKAVERARELARFGIARARDLV